MMKLDFSTYCNKNVEKIDDSIVEKIVNHDMAGWYKYYPNVDEINKISKDISASSDVLIVIGIGGSYLGSKAINDALSSYFKKNNIEVLYAGTTLSSTYINELIEYIRDKSVTINLISKSGTTLESNLIFEILYKEMKAKYTEEELYSRIIITTENDSILHDKYSQFRFLEIPKNIGGRFSIFTAAGLLPLAVNGIDIKKIVEGSLEGYNYIQEAKQYASIRHNMNKPIEAFVVYEEKLYMFTEFLKQLFAESHGKNGKGIFPVSIVNTRDLHSLGQYVQEGQKILFETIIKVKNNKDISIPNSKLTLNEINNIAINKVSEAHLLNDSESLIIEIDSLDEYNLGTLITFFFLTVSIGGFLLNVNPYDQPGVKKYKELLEKELI